MINNLSLGYGGCLMRTAGYDLVIEVNKSFINKALAKAYEDKIFKPFSGSINLPNLPLELLIFERVDYVLTLKSLPTLDVIENEDTIRGILDVDASLQVLGGLNLKIEVNASGDVTPHYDNKTQTLSIDLKSANVLKLDITGLIDPPDLPKDVTDKANEIISTLIRDKLLDKPIKLQIPAYPIPLPEVPEQHKMNVTLGTIKAESSDVLAVALNFFEDKDGDPNQLTNFNGGQDICFGISSNAMHRVFEFWWDHTTRSRTTPLPSSIEFDQFKLTTEALHSLLNQSEADPEKIAEILLILNLPGSTISPSLKLKSAKVKLDNMPMFDLKANNKIVLSCDAHLDATAALGITVNVPHIPCVPHTGGNSGIPCVPDPFHTSIEKKSYGNINLTSINNLHFTVDNAEAEISLKDTRLEANITNMNIEIHLPWKLEEHAINWVLDRIKGLIKDAINPIQLSPTLILENILDTPIILNLTLKGLNSDNVDVIACVDISIV
jgi:hypothetical protein